MTDGGARAARRTAADAGSLFAANALAAVLAAAQAVLAARWLGPRAYGVAALVTSYTSLVFLTFDARSLEPSVRFLGAFRARGSDAAAGAYARWSYVLDLGVGAVVVAAIVASAPWAARAIVHDAGRWPLIALFAVALLPTATMTSSGGILYATRRFSVVAVLDVACAVWTSGLVVALVARGWGVAGYVYGVAIGVASRALAFGVVAARTLRDEWGVSLRSGAWSDLAADRASILRFIGYGQLSAGMLTLTRYADIVLLGYHRPPVEAGYLRAARAVGDRLDFALGPLQAVVYPSLVELRERDDRAAFWGRVWSVARTVTPVVLAGGAAGVLLVPSVVPLVLGDAYAPAVRTVQLVVAAAVVRAVFFWVRPVFLAGDAIRRLTAILAGASAAMIAGWLVVIPDGGHRGAATVLLAVTVVQCLVSAALARREPRA